MPKKPREYCDFDCPHADFPPAETAGICRTMAAVWCRKLKALVNKNGPCLWGDGKTADRKAIRKSSVIQTRSRKGKSRN